MTDFKPKEVDAPKAVSNLNKWLLQWVTVLIVIAILLIEIINNGNLGWIIGIVVYFQFLWKLQWIEEGLRINSLMIKESNKVR